MRTPFIVGSVLCAGLFFTAAANAQEGRFSAHVGGGFTEPVDVTGDRLDRGYNISAGAGVNVIPQLGLNAEFLFVNNGVSRGTLDSLGYPDGDMRIYAFTLNPVIRFTREESPVAVYITGGGGIYHRNIEFTQPTVTSFTAFDPFFGVFYPVAVPADQVINSFSTTKGGINGGGGISFRLGNSRTKFFAEARYHHMFTRQPTTIVPVTFGLRW